MFSGGALSCCQHCRRTASRRRFIDHRRRSARGRVLYPGLFHFDQASWLPYQEGYAKPSESVPSSARRRRSQIFLIIFVGVSRKPPDLQMFFPWRLRLSLPAFRGLRPLRARPHCPNALKVDHTSTESPPEDDAI